MQFKTDTPMPDVFNRQIRKSVSQNQNTRTRVTRYGWDGERMCAEVKEGLTRTTIYEPGSHVPLLRIDQEEQSPESVPNLDLAPGVQRLFAPPRPKPLAHIAHYHTDHLGTPLMLTGPEGKVLWRASPDDWSAVRDEKGETDQPIRFQGQQLDEESGLHYNFNRYYDPSIGRYVTQDPIGLEGGINTYAYVGGNPISRVDPTGLQAAGGGSGAGGGGSSCTCKSFGQRTWDRYRDTSKTIDSAIDSMFPWPVNSATGLAGVAGGGFAARNYGGRTALQEGTRLFCQWNSSDFSLFRSVGKPDIVRVGATSLITAVAVGVAWNGGLLLGSALYEGLTGGGCD